MFYDVVLMYLFALWKALSFPVFKRFLKNRRHHYQDFFDREKIDVLPVFMCSCGVNHSVVLMPLSVTE